MKQGYAVRPYEPGDRAHVLELQQHLWSSDPALNEAYFSWKYEENPYASDVRIYLAFQGDQAVGMRGFFGSRWEAGVPREDVPLWLPDDLVIAPEHRNRGVFTAIMNAALEDLATYRSGFALNVGGAELTVLGQLSMGWKSIGSLDPVGLPSPRYRRLHRWRRRLDRTRFFWRLSNTRWLNVASRFDWLDRWASSETQSPGVIRVTRRPESEAMASLIQRLGHDGRIRHVRDVQYYAWRFGNPLREYRFLYAGGSELTGYLVLHRSRSNRDVSAPIHISDWEASSEEVAEGLLDAAIGGGRFPSIVAWSTALPAQATAALKSRGFLPLQRERTARGSYCGLVRSLDRALPPEQWTVAGRNLLDPGSWALRMLYSMVG